MEELLAQNKCHFPLVQGQHFVKDGIEEPIFVEENESWELYIGVHKAGVHFMQNDNCIMPGDEFKKFDWICFDDLNFYFIEAKDVKTNKKNKERRATKEKFRDTFKFYCEELNFNTENYQEVYAVLNFRNTNRITSAASKENKAYYKDTFGVTYEETNIIEFN